MSVLPVYSKLERVVVNFKIDYLFNMVKKKN